MVLVPDELQPECTETYIAPHLRPATPSLRPRLQRPLRLHHPA